MSLSVDFPSSATERRRAKIQDLAHISRMRVPSISALNTIIISFIIPTAEAAILLTGQEAQCIPAALKPARRLGLSFIPMERIGVRTRSSAKQLRLQMRSPLSRHFSPGPMLLLPEAKVPSSRPFLFSASSDNEPGGDEDENDEDSDRSSYDPFTAASELLPEPYSDEETLLQIHFVSEQRSGTGAFQELLQYTEQYPFAAVLPVQPLSYFRTRKASPSPSGVDQDEVDANFVRNGIMTESVDVSFLRKKTDLKPGQDGGIRFFIFMVPAIEEKLQSSILLVAKRNSAGQAISKIFAEKLIVLSYVQSIVPTKSLSSASGSSIPISTNNFPPTKTGALSIRSIYHKWM
jgi:hypothetical protein